MLSALNQTFGNSPDSAASSHRTSTDKIQILAPVFFRPTLDPLDLETTTG